MQIFSEFQAPGLISAANRPVGTRIDVSGTVQGVGFRPWVYRLAKANGLTGRVWNHTLGVTIDAFGRAGALDRFIRALSSAGGPAAAVIERIVTEPIPFDGAESFAIVESERTADQRITIPPDLPTCPECLAELRDPDNRRYRYPFINCTNCGPRFTIATGAPYDRPNTTMAAFEMCPACQREYDSPSDRRFHAQPNACPVCGPSLAICSPDGEGIPDGDAIDLAAAAIRAGLVVAVKGLGGFHLACDAESQAAVERLRERKHRDEKPFAVMVRDLEAARQIGVLAPEDERLLGSPVRPIVLVERREPSALAAALAPRNPLVGLMLPYTPVHHLLLDAVAGPVVMTSGNLSDEPIVCDNDEAVARLGSIADLLLVNDRPIAARCEDSIAGVIERRPMMLRRSRGCVPRPIVLARPVARPILACGALLKNTFCLARGAEACLSPHTGDLQDVSTFLAYRDAIDRLERFLAIRPEIVAHDLHPDYLSTHYAMARRGVRTVAVQHHHAHIAAVMAEHGVDGPVIGVAYDGTGLGPDHAAWGGEILVVRYDRFERAATLRPLALAGGDQAIRQPWRIALAALEDAFGGDAPLDALPLFRDIPAANIDVIRTMIRDGLNSPPAHGVGRYFDALAALGLGRAHAAYEGQLALEWNVVAEAAERGLYRYDIVRAGTPWQLDLRGMVRDAVYELIGGEPASRVAARFHNTLAAATADLVRGVASIHGRLPVALGGGCFQNARLLSSVVAHLAPDFEVLWPSQVPSGDGGLSLGQAVIADAVAGKD